MNNRYGPISDLRLWLYLVSALVVAQVVARTIWWAILGVAVP